MKTQLSTLLATLVISLLLCTPFNSVLAAPAFVAFGDDNCGLLDSTPTSGLIVISGKGHFVNTNNKNNNRKARCQAKLTPPAEGHALQYDRFNNPWCAFADSVFFPGACSIIWPAGLPVNCNGVTDFDWKQTVSASGRATLTCNVHN